MKHVCRPVLLVLMSSVLVAGEAQSEPQPGGTPQNDQSSEPKPAPTVSLQPVLISVEAGAGGLLSFNPNEPSKLLGGVTIGYEAVKITCDHVDYWQSVLPGVKRPTLDHALFATGPDAPEPGRVVFDSRESKLPAVGFRGVIHSSRVEIVRQPLQVKANQDATNSQVKPSTNSTPTTAGDQPPAGTKSSPAQPLPTVNFRVQLDDIGDFAGELLTSAGWAPHAGWAVSAELVIRADVLPGGLANPRFTSVILNGRPATHPEGSRRAMLARLRQSVPDATAVKTLGADQYDWYLKSSSITIVFDDQGRVVNTATASDTKIEGTPSLDMPVNAVPPEAAANPEPGSP